MKRISTILTIGLAVLISACSAFSSPTETPTPTETFTPTATATIAPTQTPVVIERIVTATPAPTEPTAAPASSRNSSSFATRTGCSVNSSWTTRYTVKAGDTVGRIAQASGSNVTAIAEGNCLSNANNIFVGQVLRVPKTPVFVTEEPEETEEPEVTEEATEEVTEEPEETEEATEEPEETEEATEEPEVTEEATEEPD